MKFKEIKPGMVIHCPKEEDAKALLEHSVNIGLLDTKDIRQPFSIGQENCYMVKLNECGISHGYINWFESHGYAITEFSDLIESEPRFKVGDKVRVRSDLMVGGEYGGLHLLGGRMADCRGTSATIIEITDNDCYLLDNSSFNWAGEMLEPVDDSPTDSPMSAAEVLKWLKKYRGKMELKECFGQMYAMDILFNLFTAEEILGKITAYEAAKKAPKPVEVEWVDRVKIIQIDHDMKLCVYEEDLKSSTPFIDDPDLKEQAETILKKYASEHEGEFFAVIENVCRVKEGK